MDSLLNKIERPSWMLKAGCKEHTSAFFYPSGRVAQRSVPHAVQQVCNACEVRPECLAYALDNHEQGIWGGTCEEQRHRMRDRATMQALGDVNA
jgi:WhiB family redox-sensing transcriptional regulator